MDREAHFRRERRAGSTLSGPRRAPAVSRRRSRFCKGWAAKHRTFDRFESSSAAPLNPPPLHAAFSPPRVLSTRRDSLHGLQQSLEVLQSDGEKKTEKQTKISRALYLGALSSRLLSPNGLIDTDHHSSDTHSPSTTDPSSSKEKVTTSAVVGSACPGTAHPAVTQ